VILVRERLGAQPAIGFVRAAVAVHAHLAEIDAKPMLEGRTNRWRQRCTGAAVVDGVRGNGTLVAVSA
jgi:hypothetical protein